MRQTISFIAFAALTHASAAGCVADLGATGPGVDAGLPGVPGDDDEPDRPDPEPNDPMACPANDLMIVLDRTGSMAQRPDGSLPPATDAGAAETKWQLAVAAIEEVAASYESSVRFGLALFPLDPDGDGGRDCSDLGTWLTEYLPPETNDLRCQPGEVVVEPADRSAAAVADAIDLFATGLCSTTPIGAGLTAGAAGLAVSASPDRSQAILLITDGADTCDDEYDTDSLPTADALMGRGIKTYVVGFDGSGGGIDVQHLNDLACAGGSAPSPESNCVANATGARRANAAPDPARLFYQAEDGVTFEAAVATVASAIACTP